MQIVCWECATTPMSFRDAEPVLYFNDIRPIPTPQAIDMEKFDYFATVLPTRPVVTSLSLPGKNSAKDINSMDDVPASSWFIPRLGYESISPDELLNGPTELGPPQPPLRVIRVRNPEFNPRLFVYDRREIYYMLKMDPPEYPCIATTTSFIVNRLFWGFGYNVPEDHLTFFTRDQISIAPDAELSESAIDTVLNRVAAPVVGRYRAIASRILEGLPLGPTAEKSVRTDDPNDLFPHEDRRVLRALRVFAALTNTSDFNADNTLDMYVGQSGKGYIKHHIIDFDDAFGTHAARHKRLWAGYNHIFSLKDIARNLLTTGLIMNDWERISETPWKSVGIFESRIFKPERWKETHPFAPIRKSQPADIYWAGKILGALTKEHITALVQAAKYPEPEAEKYIIETLMERRKKLLRFAVEQVTPVEYMPLSEEMLYFQDMGKSLSGEKVQECSYLVGFYDSHGHECADKRIIREDTPVFSVPLTFVDSLGPEYYLRVDISKQGKKRSQTIPAQFHFIKKVNSPIHLVGVVH